MLPPKTTTANSSCESSCMPRKTGKLGPRLQHPFGLHQTETLTTKSLRACRTEMILFEEMSGFLIRLSSTACWQCIYRWAHAFEDHPKPLESLSSLLTMWCRNTSCEMFITDFECREANSFVYADSIVALKHPRINQPHPRTQKKRPQPLQISRDDKARWVTTGITACRTHASHTKEREHIVGFSWDSQ